MYSKVHDQVRIGETTLQDEATVAVRWQDPPLQDLEQQNVSRVSAARGPRMEQEGSRRGPHAMSWEDSCRV